MTGEKLDEKAIFNIARTIESSEARAEYLRQACSNETELIERIQSLLRGYGEQASFLESPPAAIALGRTASFDDSIAERPGTVIGPYKLLQQIGEGGMGVVFMAEQTEPIHRTVALKIIKPGMDTRQVIARFEAERQALAMMDHPNIAKVLDAGTTTSPPLPQGEGRGEGALPLSPDPRPLTPPATRPFFVMELVRGVPITKYCDDKQLTIRQRLELFKPVCEAVQHAHQKGIIHRDLKPTNVLVAEYDNRPVPKVIDFGVAKATAQKLTERTMFTEFGQLIGTFEYMSPEQAKLNQLDVDTRSDIYSLGVLLYELLTGSTPFDRDRLRSAAFDEVLRIIREEEPPKPSTRLQSGTVPILSSPRDKMGLSPSPSPPPLPGEGRGECALSLASIAANRQTEPTRLSKDVSGELDWIVMKALDKDRNRRYGSAGALTMDLQHYLLDEPVVARPTTRAYRVQKFIRRNKAAVFAGAAVVAALVVGLALATLGLLQARDQARIARAEAARATQTQQFLQEMLASINPDSERGAATTVQQVVDRAATKIETAFPDQPEIRAVLHETIGRTYYGLLLYEPATRHLKQSAELRRQYLPDDSLALADAEFRLAQAYSWDLGQLDLALDHCRTALRLYRSQLPESDSRVVLAKSLESHLTGQTAGHISDEIWGARALPVALALTRDQIAKLPDEWGRAITSAQQLNRSGDFAGARAALQNGHLAVVGKIRALCTAGQMDDARQFLRQAYAPWLEMPLVKSVIPVSLISEAWELNRRGIDRPVIEVFLREAVFAGNTVWDSEHPYIARALTDLANVLREQRKFTEAEPLAREAMEMRRKLLGTENPDTITSVKCLIDVLTNAGKQAEADSLRKEIGEATDRETSK